MVGGCSRLPPHRHQVNVFDPERIVLSAQPEGLGILAKQESSLKGSFAVVNPEHERPLQGRENMGASNPSPSGWADRRNNKRCCKKGPDVPDWNPSNIVSAARQTSVSVGATRLLPRSFGGTVMADDRKTHDRVVRRSFECHRLEEQLWSLAYQQVLAMIRQKTKANGVQSKQPYYEQARKTPTTARSA